MKFSSKLLSHEHSSGAPEIRRALLHVGLFSRVAASLQVTPGHVIHVAKGARESLRVQKAIVAEVQRIERETQQKECAA